MKPPKSLDQAPSICRSKKPQSSSSKWIVAQQQNSSTSSTTEASSFENLEPLSPNSNHSRTSTISLIARSIYRASHMSKKKNLKRSKCDAHTRFEPLHRFPTDFASLLCNQSLRCTTSATPANKVRIMLRMSGVSSCRDPATCCMRVDTERGHVTIVDTNNTPSHRPSINPKLFFYDSIFAPTDNLEKICSESIPDLIRCVLNGIDACLFSFGQARLGKTYSMIGMDDAVENLGVIPCALGWLFRAVEDERQKTGGRYSLRVSAIEVSGRKEEIRDLLVNYSSDVNHEKCPQLHDDAITGVKMADVIELRVASAQQAGHYLDAAIASRIIPETKDEIRNSHFIFAIHLYHYRLEAETRGQVTGGKSSLHLLDLGSCGRSGESGSALNLSALGIVITALLNGQRHVPYRESRLALILKTILGNIQCHVTGLIHVSPLNQHAQESLQVMQLCSKMNRAQKPRRKPKELLRSGVRMGTWQRGSDYTSSSDQSSQCETVIFAGHGFRSDQASTTDDSTVISVGRSSGRLSSSSRACSSKMRRLKPVIESCLEGQTLSRKALDETWIDGPAEHASEQWIDGPAELRSQATSVKPSISKIVKVPSLAIDRPRHASKLPSKTTRHRAASKSDEDVIGQLASVRAEEKTMAWVSSLTQFDEEEERREINGLTPRNISSVVQPEMITMRRELGCLRHPPSPAPPIAAPLQPQHLSSTNEVLTSRTDVNRNVEMSNDFNANVSGSYLQVSSTSTAASTSKNLEKELLNGRESIYELQMDGELERGSSRESLIQLYYASDEDGSLWGTMHKQSAQSDDRIKSDLLNGNDLTSIASVDVSFIERTIKNLYFSETRSGHDLSLDIVHDLAPKVAADDFDCGTLSSEYSLPPPLHLSSVFSSKVLLASTPIYQFIDETAVQQFPDVSIIHRDDVVEADDVILKADNDPPSKPVHIACRPACNPTNERPPNKSDNQSDSNDQPSATPTVVELKVKKVGILRNFLKSSSKSNLPVLNAKAADLAASSSKKIFSKQKGQKEKAKSSVEFQKNLIADKCKYSPSLLRSLALTSPYSRITRPIAPRGCGSESGCSSALTSASGRTRSIVTSELDSSGYDSNSKEENQLNRLADVRTKKFRSKSAPSKWIPANEDGYNIGHLSLRCQHHKLTDIDHKLPSSNQDDPFSKHKNIKIKCFDCLNRTDSLKISN